MTSLAKKIAHNTIIQIIGKIVSTLLGLVALGMMARYFATDDRFGWYITTITFLQFIGILTDFGLIPLTAQMLSEAGVDTKKLVQNLLGFRLTTAIFFFALAPFIAFFFPYPREVKIAISFTTISFLAIAINQIFTGYYQTRLKMHLQVVGEVIGRIVLVVGIFLLIQGRSNFLPIMTIVTLSSVVYTIVLWIFVQRDTPTTPRFDADVWRAITKKMWPIALAIIFNVVYLKGDVLILTLLRTQKEVGNYGAAYRVIDLLTQAAMLMMGLLLPLLASAWSREKKEEFHAHYQRSFDTMLLFAIPLTIGSIILATPIMQLVAGNTFDYTASGNMLRILSIAVFGVYLGAIFGHMAVAINKQKQTLWIYISNAILTLIGYLIFIPRYGTYGAAWMTVFSELYTGLLLWFIIRRYTKEKIIPTTGVKLLFSGLVMGGVLFLFQDLHVMLLVPVGMVIYGFFALGFGAVSKETIKEVIGIKNNE